MNELRGLTLFLRAADLGSLRKAAIDQGLTPQAVSLAVTQLEKALGVRLFHRTTRSLSLTEDGRALYERSAPAMATLADAVSQARRARDDVGGLVTVSAPTAFARAALWPLFLEFADRHPDVRLDVRFDDRFTDLVQEGADVGFRGGSLPAEGAIARRLLPISLVVCAAPAYLARHGAPRSIEALAQHRCSGYRQPNTGKLAPWIFRVGDERIALDVQPVVTCNDIDAEADAVLSGTVIGQLASFSAAEHLRAGRLVPLLVEHVASLEGIHVYYRHRAEQPRRVRAFIDFVCERLAQDGRHVLAPEELRALALR